LAIALGVSARIVAGVFGEPRLIPILIVLSTAFVISGLSVVHKSLLEKELRFAALASVEVPALAFGSIAGISCAWWGLGVWSLVIQSIVTTLFSSVAFWIRSGWIPSWHFKWLELRRVAPFSLSVTGFGLVNYGARNTDDFLIGRYLGASQLGVYGMAYRIMLFPLQNLTQVVARVMFPVYSLIQDDDDRIRTVYLETISAIATLTFPLMTGAMILHDAVVLTALGGKWAPVSVLLAVLAPVGMMQSIVSMNGALYRAKGRAGLQFGVGSLFSAITIAGFLVGLRWGVLGVATAYAIVNLFLLYPSLRIVLKLVDGAPRQVVRSVWRPLVCSAAMAVVVVAARWALPFRVGTWVQLICLTGIGVVSYLLVCSAINRANMRKVLMLFKSQAIVGA
jgi:PST family polysaccharide transporter